MKQPPEPSLPFYWPLALFLYLVPVSEELLLDHSRMESLSRCRRLLDRDQRRAALGQPSVQLGDLLVLHGKLLIFSV